MDFSLGELVERLGLLKHFELLNDFERDTFLKSLRKLSEQQWFSLKKLVQEYNSTADLCRSTKLEKPNYFSLRDRADRSDEWNLYVSTGEQIIRSGRVCLLTVAGGQGTRLGFNGPKGLFPATPIKKKPLFKIFAEKIIAAERKYNIELHWLVMASEENFEDTCEYFNSSNIFPLNKLHIFKQGALPSFDLAGNCLMQSMCSIGYHPDGHGGVFDAIHNSGLIGTLKALGIDTISYFQVDNPLVQLLDAGFIGLHSLKKSEMSSKVVAKRCFEEKVGVFVKKNNALKILEYIDMTQDEISAADEFGQPLYNLGNAAIHLLDLNFVADVVEKNELPVHVAKKSVPYWDNTSSRIISPNTTNALKLEKFIFDALPFAKNPALLEIDRAEEFSPIKNFTGPDSLQTSLADQINRWQNWFYSVDKNFHVDVHKQNTVAFEISPIFADNFSDFVGAWNKLENKPSNLTELYLE